MANRNAPKARTLQAVAAGILVALAGTLVFAVGHAASKNSSVIGPVRDVAKPTCPTPSGSNVPSYKQCNAFGHVTGFQLRTSDQRAVHKIRKNGHIVAWSLDLGKPGKNSDEQKFFEDVLRDQTFHKYGSKPVANIGILKKKTRTKNGKKPKKGRFKLAKQSPIVNFSKDLGNKPIVTLKKPLKVKKGEIVALTTPTWVTNFALQAPGKHHILSKKNKWRASRKSTRCNAVDKNGDGDYQDPGEIDNLTKKSHPQYKKGSTRTYGCIYTQAQILYWAYFVPSGKGGGGKGGKGGKNRHARRSSHHVRKAAIASAAGNQPATGGVVPVAP